MIERWRLSSMHVLPSPTINLFGDKQQTVTTTPPLDALAFILAFDPSQTKLENIFRREETASPFCWPSKLVECKVCRNANTSQHSPSPPLFKLPLFCLDTFNRPMEFMCACVCVLFSVSLSVSVGVSPSLLMLIVSTLLNSHFASASLHAHTFISQRSLRSQ